MKMYGELGYSPFTVLHLELDEDEWSHDALVIPAA